VFVEVGINETSESQIKYEIIVIIIDVEKLINQNIEKIGVIIHKLENLNLLKIYILKLIGILKILN
jgi:hypothetical protein